MSAPIDRLMGAVTWEAVEPPADNPDGMPFPTHAGVLNLGGIELQCYVLNTGQRIIDAESMERLFGAI